MMLVFFLEEPSARAFLQSFLPRILPIGIAVRYFVYRGKQDLKKNITKDLRPLRHTSAQHIVLVDQDYADCQRLKATLFKICVSSGVISVIRIACRELESWYLAQLDAVEQEYALRGLVAQQSKRKFRNPDILTTPDVLLQRLTHYGYNKIDGSRRLGRRINPDVRRSPSFAIFVDALRNAVATLLTPPPQGAS